MLSRDYSPVLAARLLRTCPLAVSLAAAAWSLVVPARAQAPGRTLLFTAGGNGERRFDLWATASPGADPVNLTASEGQEYDPALSPDGTRIAYTAAVDPREPRVDLWVMNVDGTSRRRLTRTGQYVLAPSWSPDGRRIAFSTITHRLAGAPEFGMRVIDGDGRNEGSLGTGLWPLWSPDGTRLLFTALNSARDWSPALMAASADGSDPKPVGPNESMMGAWSPDGKRIAYVAEADKQAELFVMEADGSRRTRLTRTPEFEVGPQWSPDGTRLLFTRLPKDDPASARIWSLDSADKKAAAVPVSRSDRMEILGPVGLWLLGVPGAE